MKKLLKISVSFFTLSLVVFIGCKKEDTKLFSLESEKLTRNQNSNLLSQDDNNKIIERIDKFTKVVAELRKDQNVDYQTTIDDFVWDIEALFNTQNTWRDVKYTSSDTRSFKISIGANEQKLSSVEVLAYYNSIHDFLLQHDYSLSNRSIHKLIMVDIDILQGENGENFLTITSVFATSTDETDKKSSERNLVDIRAMSSSSQCANGEYGPTKLASQINANKPVYPPTLTFIDIENITYNTNGFDNVGNEIPGTQRRKAKTYFSTNREGCNPVSGFFTCYPIDDHNWYYTNWWTNINGPFKPANKLFKHINITEFAGSTYCQGPNTPIPLIGFSARHDGTAYYGKLVPFSLPCCPIGQ
jgi:hypothetical protein